MVALPLPLALLYASPVLILDLEEFHFYSYTSVQRMVDYL